MPVETQPQAQPAESTVDGGRALDDRRYHIIRRPPDQLSIWPADLEPPDDWSIEGDVGSREACLDAICQRWSTGPCGPDVGPVAGSATFPALFEQVVHRYPDVPAVVTDDEVLTYDQLNRRSNRLARRLIDQGVGPDRLVAIGLHRSPELIITILAVLKAGGAYLPLDPNYPTERLRFLMSDARPLMIIRSPDFDLPRQALSELVLDDDANAVLEQLRDDNVTDAERLLPLDLLHQLYVIYTSGSTGDPKGVVISGAGLRQLVATQAATVAPRPGDRVLQWASISFDAAFWDLTLALLSGATLVVADQDQLLPGRPLAETTRRHAITVATLPPAALTALDPTDCLPGVTLVSTGDTCSATLVELWSKDRRMFNGYGPTEATVGATIAGPLSPHDGDPDIGLPFVGDSVLLLDDDLEPVPHGVPGEMFLAGPGLALGYLNRPDLTAENFLPNPFGPPGSRMYRSGDVGLIREDGRLYFLGRNDNQIKLRGYRVELDEVERALHAFPSVVLAAVVKRGRFEDASLAGFVTTEDPSVTGEDLRTFLEEKLPAYMVPSSVTVLDRMPTNPNGKIDRKALLAREGEHRPKRPRRTTSRPDDSSDDERTATTWFLCDVVADIVDDDVKPEDNFFRLGGTSIQVAQIVERVEDEYGLRIPIRPVFETPTLQDLAQHIDQART